VGLNQLNFPSQVRLNPGRIDQLNSQYPQAGFSRRFFIPPGTQAIRMSTGAEFQVRVPRISAPLRFYLAYNPLVFRDIVKSPPFIDRSYFPNNATFENAINTVGAPKSLRSAISHSGSQSGALSDGRGFTAPQSSPHYWCARQT
jgi:outer membrane protein insertion porin family